MANEHVIDRQVSPPQSFTCANANGIEKGTVLVLSDPSTVAAHASVNQIPVGIAYTEKIANDGNTQIAVVCGPGDIVKGIASGSITAGDPLGLATAGFANYLYTLKGLDSSLISGSIVIGESLETATVGQTFKYVLKIQSV